MIQLNIVNCHGHWENTSLKNITQEIDGVFYKEKWKCIPGFEKYYQVSNMGRVKSLPYTFIAKNGEHYPVKGKILKQEKTSNGYLRTTLSVSIINKKKRYLVHRLVGIVFIPNPLNKPYINHINGITTDNRFMKIEWSTQKENINHAINVLGRKYIGHLGKFGLLNHNSKKVKQINPVTNEIIKIWDSISDIKRSKKGGSGVVYCCQKKQNISNGYKWEYA